MPKESKKMTFHIEGMHCVSCSVLINKILGKEKGVKRRSFKINAGIIIKNYGN